MNMLRKFSLVFSALAAAVSFTATTAYAADHGGDHGMKVPKIGSMLSLIHI